jgi:hypothetical protein
LIRGSGRFQIGLAALTAIVAAGAFACASLLDIQTLPVRVDGSPSGPVVDAAIDVGCPPPDATFCQMQCPPADFCDDFEGTEVAPKNKWTAPVGFENPVISGDGRLTLGNDDAGTQARALIADIRSTVDDSASAIIATTLPTAGRNLRGLHVHFEARPAELTFIDDGGTARRGISVFAVGGVAINLGVGVMLYEDVPGELLIALQERKLGGQGDKFPLMDVISGPMQNYQPNSLAYELYVGTPTALADHRVSCELPPGVEQDAGPDEVRLAIQVGQAFLAPKCTRLEGDLRKTDWLQSAGIITGASVSDFGQTSVRIRNVLVELWD